MSERMLRSGFQDGALFHAFHAYECAISVLIGGYGLPVPTDHARRFMLLNRLLSLESPHAETNAILLAVLTVQTRSKSLYFDEGTNQLPTDRFDRDFVARVLPIVHRFAREVLTKIR